LVLYHLTTNIHFFTNKKPKLKPQTPVFVMQLIENEFPSAIEWHLDTPHLNTRTHHFYEKLGYEKIGEHQVSEKLILFDYMKKMNH